MHVQVTSHAYHKVLCKNCSLFALCRPFGQASTRDRRICKTGLSAAVVHALAACIVQSVHSAKDARKYSASPCSRHDLPYNTHKFSSRSRPFQYTCSQSRHIHTNSVIVSQKLFRPRYHQVNTEEIRSDFAEPINSFRCSTSCISPVFL